MTRRTTTKRGFTLVEMIVVLLIILSLLGMLYPALQASRERARSAACQNNLHQLLLAMEQYYDLRKSLPSEHAWPVELLPFLEDENTTKVLKSGRKDVGRPLVFSCPSHLELAGNVSKVDANLYAFVIDPNLSRRLPYVRFSDRPREVTSTEIREWWYGPEKLVLPGELNGPSDGPHTGEVLKSNILRIDYAALRKRGLEIY
jgi:prepilin-type N-terminal cleavage/methylation domain-containing protein